LKGGGACHIEAAAENRRLGHIEFAAHIHVAQRADDSLEKRGGADGEGGARAQRGANGGAGGHGQVRVERGDTVDVQGGACGQGRADVECIIDGGGAVGRQHIIEGRCARGGKDRDVGVSYDVEGAIDVRVGDRAEESRENGGAPHGERAQVRGARDVQAISKGTQAGYIENRAQIRGALDVEAALEACLFRNVEGAVGNKNIIQGGGVGDRKGAVQGGRTIDLERIMEVGGIRDIQGGSEGDGAVDGEATMEIGGADNVEHAA